MFDVDRIANLASLELKDEERKHFEESMNNILNFVETISHLELGEQEPVIRNIELPTILREDTVGDSLTQSALEENSPQMKDSFIIVPQVIKR